MKLSDSSLKKIQTILKEHDVIRAQLFGSYARGDADKKSDIDIIIRFDRRKRKSLLDLVGLKLELEDKMGKKVDVAMEGSIHPLIEPYIKEDTIRIL